jgi:hypothetical protein
MRIVKFAWLPVFGLGIPSPCTAAPFATELPPDRKTLALPIKKSLRPAGLEGRDVEAILSNNLVGYLVEVEVGTPSQSVIITIDTGSSDTWMFGPGSCTTCKGGICKSQLFP